MSRTRRAGGATREHASEEAIWQELEFGSHRADLELWEEIASEAGGPVLELGAGAGRVALHLARAGREVIAVEREAALADELERRGEGLPIRVVRADLAELAARSLPGEPRAALAPLHVLQQLDPGARGSRLAELAEALPADSRLGAALVDESSFVTDELEPKPLPDMREVDGLVYSSEPLWLQVDEGSIRVRRMRERVSPEGEIERSVHDDVLERLSPAALEAAADEAGFSAVQRRPLRTGTHEADSIAVILERR